MTIGIIIQGRTRELRAGGTVGFDAAASSPAGSCEVEAMAINDPVFRIVVSRPRTEEAQRSSSPQIKGEDRGGRCLPKTTFREKRRDLGRPSSPALSRAR